MVKKVIVLIFCGSLATVPFIAFISFYTDSSPATKMILSAFVGIVIGITSVRLTKDWLFREKRG